MIAERFGRNGMNLVSVSAPRTIPARCATVGDLMPVSAIGAIPGVRTKRLSAGSVTRAAVAVGTVPVPGGTGFVVSMSRFIAAAAPAVFAGFVFGVTPAVAAVAIFAPPIMRTAFGFGINSRRRIRLKTVDAKPITVRACVCRRMVRFFAGGARPIVYTAFRCT